MNQPDIQGFVRNIFQSLNIRLFELIVILVSAQKNPLKKRIQVSKIFAPERISLLYFDSDETIAIDQ